MVVVGSYVGFSRVKKREKPVLKVNQKVQSDVFPGKCISGQPASLTFVAGTPGVWEVELEGAGIELFELVVTS